MLFEQQMYMPGRYNLWQAINDNSSDDGWLLCWSATYTSHAITLLVRVRVQ